MHLLTLAAALLCCCSAASKNDGGQLEQMTLVVKNQTYCRASDLERPDVAFNVSEQYEIDKVLPARCLLKRFENDREAALSILRGKHLVIVGDSINRYMYLSLVYFLETGNFTSPYPSQTWEKDYSNWTDFYQVTYSHRHSILCKSLVIVRSTSRDLLAAYVCFTLGASLLQLQITNARLNGHEKCDCHRIGLQDFPMVENRYYYNPDTQVRITFFQWFGRYCMLSVTDAFQALSQSIVTCLLCGVHIVLQRWHGSAH
jgi:GDSL/SGNH-like Acyl-Esterase family found in Pmr5 and Cas1p